MVKRVVAGLGAAVALALPAGPAAATEATAIVRVVDCPPGYTGYVVEAWNEKRGWYEVTSFCIPWGP